MSEQPIDKFMRSAQHHFIHYRPLMAVNRFDANTQYSGGLRLIEPSPEVAHDLSFTNGQSLAFKPPRNWRISQRLGKQLKQFIWAICAIQNMRGLTSQNRLFLNCNNRYSLATRTRPAPMLVTPPGGCNHYISSPPYIRRHKADRFIISPSIFGYAAFYTRSEIAIFIIYDDI